MSPETIKNPNTTASGIPIKNIYTMLDKSLGLPGEFPFLRGIYKNMYQGRLWTVRNAAGFGDSTDTNIRLKQQLDNGQTGISLAFDLPTFMGYDSDDTLAYGEFGKCGVACSSLRDMENILEDIQIDNLSVSLDANATSAPIMAMYIAAAEKKGVDTKELRGTIQNDPLKEFVAQKGYVFSPDVSLRLAIDLAEYCHQELPKWNAINVSGYHIREAGSNAIEELAFTISNGKEYVKRMIERGMPIDSFANRITFYFNVNNDFFEEISKLRAARIIWAEIVKNEFHARDMKSMRLKFHAHTSGLSLTAQQPENNFTRASIQTLAAILGGAQSIHTCSFDEALGLPSEKASRIALNTQQILIFETGVTKVIDPLGGSFFIESLTGNIQNEAIKIINKIDEMGGSLEYIKKGFMQRAISESSNRTQREITSGNKIVVGVNSFQTCEKPIGISPMKISEQSLHRQLDRLKTLRVQRDNTKVEKLLSELSEVCNSKQNIMPKLIEAVKADATLGEIMSTMKRVFGEYFETESF